MTEKDIKNYNRRCAEFLGWESPEDESSLNFHSDWDLIMKVIDKIKEINNELILIEVLGRYLICRKSDVTLENINYTEEKPGRELGVAKAIDYFLISHELKQKVQIVEDLVKIPFSVSLALIDFSKKTTEISSRAFIVYAFSKEEALDLALDIIKNKKKSVVSYRVLQISPIAKPHTEKNPDNKVLIKAINTFISKHTTTESTTLDKIRFSVTVVLVDTNKRDTEILLSSFFTYAYSEKELNSAIDMINNIKGYENYNLASYNILKV